MQRRTTWKLAAAAAFAASLSMGTAYAADTIKIADIVELSGPGTTSGTMFAFTPPEITLGLTVRCVQAWT